MLSQFYMFLMIAYISRKLSGITGCLSTDLQHISRINSVQLLQSVDEDSMLSVVSQLQEAAGVS